jgi:hypothetical protein
MAVLSCRINRNPADACRKVLNSNARYERINNRSDSGGSIQMKSLARYLTHTLRKWNVPVLAEESLAAGHGKHEHAIRLTTGSSGKRALVAILAMGIVLLAGTAVSRAQQITGTLVGTVQDAQGAVVQRASVAVTNTDTGVKHSAVSNALGEYRVEYLQVGNYEVAVEAKGFKKFLQKKVVILADQTQRVDASLIIGEDTETVTVTTAPPLINTSTAEIGRTLESDELTQLPLPNRNPYTQLSLTPGVLYSSSSGAGGANYNSQMGQPAQQAIINGGTDGGSATVSYYLDGGINMNGLRQYGNPVPDPDALQEFRVETNNYDAQYGRFGSGVVTVVTRSGTNAFHGSLFEFNRNTALNDTPWESPTNILTGKPLNAPYHRNQFGGTVGGPIIHGKTFFFFSYGGLRQITDKLESGAVVPTPLERLGDFTQSATIPNMPGTSTPVAGTNSSSNCLVATKGCVPSTLFDPTAQAILKAYVPLPLTGISTNSKGAQNGWAGYFPSPYNDDEYLFKVDHQLSERNHLNASYFHISLMTETSGGGNILWSGQKAADTQDNFNVSDTHVFNSGLINQAWLTYVRSAGSRVNYSMPPISGTASSFSDLSSFGSKFTIQGPSSLPSISVSGYFSLGNSIMGPKAGSDFYSIRDVVSKTKGKHSLNLGAEMMLDKDVQRTDLNNYGVFSFSTSATGTTGNALADFLDGIPATMEQDTPDEAITNSWYYAFYLQDNYRVTPRLTLDLGLRYDFQTPPTDNGQNREATFVPGAQSTVIPNAPVGLLFANDKGVARGTIPIRWHHVSPRVGMAYDPFGDGKTSIRAAAGIFYGTVAGNEWNATSNFAPFAIRPTYSNIKSLTNIYGDTVNFPKGDPYPYNYTPSNVIFLPNSNEEGASLGFQYPYTYQVNASVQRQLPGNASVTIAYVSALSHDLPFQNDVNYDKWAPGASTSTANEESRHPYDPGILNQVQLIQPAINSSYNSLQISASKRMSRHFSMNGFYVFGHAIWNGPVAVEASGDIPQDFSTMQGERGSTDTDLRHTSSISGIWDISYFDRSNKWMGELLNGWQISPVVFLNSGPVLNLQTGSDKNADEYSTDRPDWVAGVSPKLSPHRPRLGANSTSAEWFNTAAFQASGAGVPGGIGPGGADGNVSRNAIFGPGYRDIDLGLFRTVNVWESMKIQFRAEATNAFNLVNLSTPGTSNPQTINPVTGAVTAASSSFGKITSAGTPRQIQIGARFTF